MGYGRLYAAMRKERVVQAGKCYHLVSRVAHRAFFFIQKGLTLLPYALGMYELYHVEALEMPLPTLTAGCPAALGRCDLQKAGPVLSSWLNAFLIECLARK